MKTQGAITRLRNKRFTLFLCVATWLVAFLTTDILHNDAEHMLETGVKHHLCAVCHINHTTPQAIAACDGSSLDRPVYAESIVFAPASQDLESEATRFALIARGPPAA